MADCHSRRAYPTGKACINISMGGYAEETAEARRNIEAERLLEEGDTKCFVVMGCRAELAQVRDAKVQAVEAQKKKEHDMV